VCVYTIGHAFSRRQENLPPPTKTAKAAPAFAAPFLMGADDQRKIAPFYNMHLYR
jgi:hypothetical protein